MAQRKEGSYPKPTGEKLNFSAGEKRMKTYCMQIGGGTTAFSSDVVPTQLKCLNMERLTDITDELYWILETYSWKTRKIVSHMI